MSISPSQQVITWGQVCNVHFTGAAKMLADNVSSRRRGGGWSAPRCDRRVASVLRSEKAVTAHLKSKQLLPFCFARPRTIRETYKIHGAATCITCR